MTIPQGVGDPDADPIVISPQPGHRVAIDGARREFIEDPGHAWVQVTPQPPPATLAEADLPGPETTPTPVVEYRSVAVLPFGTEHGAFTTGGQLGRHSFTKLITYDQHRDLLALNERFGKLPPEMEWPPGPMVKGGEPVCTGAVRCIARAPAFWRFVPIVQSPYMTHEREATLVGLVKEPERRVNRTRHLVHFERTPGPWVYSSSSGREMSSAGRVRYTGRCEATVVRIDGMDKDIAVGGARLF